jgi:nitrogen fixation/metabolism regulation signal transduction histidine kinase
LSRVRRTVQWSAVALVTLGALWAFYRSSVRIAAAGPRIAASPQHLTLLTLAIIVLALAFVGILVRNVVRLIVDRKRGVLGARLRTKLVFFFLALVLLPAFLLSFGAGAFIKETVEGLMRTPVEEVSRQAKEIVKEAGRREEARLLAHAKLLAQILHEIPPAASDGRRVATIQWRQREALEIAGFILADGTIFVDGDTGAATTGLSLDVATRELPFSTRSRRGPRCSWSGPCRWTRPTRLGDPRSSASSSALI